MFPGAVHPCSPSPNNNNHTHFVLVAEDAAAAHDGAENAAGEATHLPSHTSAKPAEQAAGGRRAIPTTTTTTLATSTRCE